MKNWKKYLALLTALLLVAAFVACTPVEEEPSDPPADPTEAATQAPTETPTEAPTEAPTEVEADYSAYMGNWYSGTVTLIVKEESAWAMEDNGEVFMTGRVIVGEEGNLFLYDVEGVEVASMLLEEDGTVYAELYVEEMYSKVSDFTFTRTASSSDIVVDVEEPVVEENIVEETISEEPEIPEEG